VSVDVHGSGMQLKISKEQSSQCIGILNFVYLKDSGSLQLFREQTLEATHL
jgi:hypothetical protein